MSVTCNVFEWLHLFLQHVSCFYDLICSCDVLLDASEKLSMAMIFSCLSLHNVEKLRVGVKNRLFLFSWNRDKKLATERAATAASLKCWTTWTVRHSFETNNLCDQKFHAQSSKKYLWHPENNMYLKIEEIAQRRRVCDLHSFSRSFEQKNSFYGHLNLIWCVESTVEYSSLYNRVLK